MYLVYARVIALCVSVLAVCLAGAEVIPMGSIPAISGLARLEGATYIAVHDVKTTGTTEDAGVRVSLIDFSSHDAAKVAPMDIDWSLLGGELPNDLEAVCALPDHSNEFLIVESSYKEGKFGRIIRLEVAKNGGAWSGKAVQTQHFPSIIPGTVDQELDNIEGCVAFNAGSRTSLVLGKRGKNGKDALLFTGDYFRDAADFVPAHVQGFATPFRDRPIPDDKRYCGELLIDGDRLLALSCEDTGNDDGPFESALYQIGTISSAAAIPVTIDVVKEALFEFPGHKIEALAPSPQAKYRFVAASDDENFGGAVYWFSPVLGK